MMPLLNPAMARIREHERRARALLVPVIREREARAAAASGSRKEGVPKAMSDRGGDDGQELEEDDLLQFMIAKYEAEVRGTLGERDLDRLNQGMLLNTGGILSACCVLTQM